MDRTVKNTPDVQSLLSVLTSNCLRTKFTQLGNEVKEEGCITTRQSTSLARICIFTADVCKFAAAICCSQSNLRRCS